MNAREELAQVIHGAPALVAWNGEQRVIADAILAAGYSKPRTITEGVVHVNTLPELSVIRTKQGYALEKMSGGWYRAGVDYAYTPNPQWLPATVLYTPRES